MGFGTVDFAAGIGADRYGVPGIRAFGDERLPGVGAALVSRVVRPAEKRV